MQWNSPKIVHRVFLTDGIRLYPQSGYDRIDPIIGIHPYLFRVKREEHFGIIDARGQVIVAVEHDCISVSVTSIKGHSFLSVQDNGLHGLIKIQKLDSLWDVKLTTPCEWVAIYPMVDGQQIWGISQAGEKRIINPITGENFPYGNQNQV